MNENTCFRLYKCAKEAREAQRKYFRTRDSYDLRSAKALERELDEAIETFRRTVLEGEPAQGDLFQGEVANG